MAAQFISEAKRALDRMNDIDHFNRYMRKLAKDGMDCGYRYDYLNDSHRSIKTILSEANEILDNIQDCEDYLPEYYRRYQKAEQMGQAKSDINSLEDWEPLYRVRKFITDDEGDGYTSINIGIFTYDGRYAIHGVLRYGFKFRYHTNDTQLDDPLKCAEGYGLEGITIIQEERREQAIAA